MKHNNALPSNHFRKHWQVNVKTWFDQPGRKLRRRVARLQKAKAIAPRPVDGVLRPAVRCQTLKYNTKLREGRGFSLGELKAMKIGKLKARSLGISVDHRRRSVSEINKARLGQYLSKIVILPKGGNSKKCATGVPQLGKGELAAVKTVFTPEKARAVKPEEKEFSAYAQRRKEANTKRFAGIRAKRAAEKAEKTESKK